MTVARRAPLGPSAVFLMVLLPAACSGEGRPTATPAPTATPVTPILFAGATTNRDIANQVSEEERQCMKQGLGQEAYDRYLNSELSEGSLEEEQQLQLQCFSNETFARFLIGFTVGSLGGLSDATVTCMFTGYGKYEAKSAFQEDVELEEGIVQVTKLCLNEDERVRAEAFGLFGEPEAEPTPTRERVVGSPGLIDVGGRQLYLVCEGSGSPTVVMESGGIGRTSGLGSRKLGNSTAQDCRVHPRLRL